MKFGLTLPFEIVIVFVCTGPADVGDVGESPLQATAITSATGNAMLQTRYFQCDTDALQPLAAPTPAQRDESLDWLGSPIPTARTVNED
jgi:hypothetical protein